MGKELAIWERGGVLILQPLMEPIRQCIGIKVEVLPSRLSERLLMMSIGSAHISTSTEVMILVTLALRHLASSLGASGRHSRGLCRCSWCCQGRELNSNSGLRK